MRPSSASGSAGSTGVVAIRPKVFAALIDFGFSVRGLDRIWAQTMTVNQRSRRVMEACGMTQVRTFRMDWPEVIDGTEYGDVECEIRRSPPVA